VSFGEPGIQAIVFRQYCCPSCWTALYSPADALRDEVSYARMAGVEGLPSPGAAGAATR
jgi:hypothetical protein